MSLESKADPAPVVEMREVAIGAAQDPARPAIEQINWSVGAGDFWIVGGLQGAGKSDLLRTTGGLMAPLAGRYHFCGQVMPIFEDQRLSERLRLGYVFEGGQLFNHLTISENVSLAPRYHRNLTGAEAGGEVREMLELTELSSLANSTPGAIARNWQQRAGLARALMLKPEVLLLDNPLAGLDLRHRGWWLSFLDQLSRGHAWMNHRPTTLIATADDLRPWRKRARQFAILKNRRFLILGSWEHVEAAGEDFVGELLAAPPQGG